MVNTLVINFWCGKLLWVFPWVGTCISVKFVFCISISCADVSSCKINVCLLYTFPAPALYLNIEKRTWWMIIPTLRWRHNWRDSVSNHQPLDCLLNRLFGCRSKKASKLRVTGLCAGNSPVTGEFPAQMASNAKNISIWWRHHDACIPLGSKDEGMFYGQTGVVWDRFEVGSVYNSISLCLLLL